MPKDHTVSAPATPTPVDEQLYPDLVSLAHAYAIATEYWDWTGRHTPVPRSTVVAVLAALDVAAETPEQVTHALVEVTLRAWRQVLPPCVVLREGVSHRLPVHVAHGHPAQVWIDLEDGSRVDLSQMDFWVDPRLVDGRLVGEASFQVPGDLPMGYHVVNASHEGGTSRSSLVVTPARLELQGTGRAWGLMTQLYQLRSAHSWGVGDLNDLGELAAWASLRHGADFVLVNPLHAAQPVPPMEPSPYLPTTRRFANPLYLRIEDIPEVAYLPSTDRAVVEWEAEEIRAHNADPDRIDRDAVWAAKLAALEAVYTAPLSPGRRHEFESYKEREGVGLRDFATWCAFAERFGLPDDAWPDFAHDPRSAGTAALRQELADRVDFYCWLQWCMDEQLRKVQTRALDAGMGIGLMHDLAVGVHPGGADAWALGDTLARSISVGAPADAFNQQGQDWSQPPWRPDRLAELGYAPFRDMVRTQLRSCGALRVDHVLGLFRLWWVPRGMPASAGTYVRYDHEAMVGILCLEAHRSSALVIGEDLGTVEPWVRDYLADRGVLGTSILWFEREGQGRPVPPERWRQLCLATVTTHDLPPTAGYLDGEHIRVREDLGLLTRPVHEERAADEADRHAVLDLLRERGLLTADADEQATVEALHRLLSLTPCHLVGVQVSDLVGDRRAINQPGTCDEYPNWRLPLTDEKGEVVLLDDVFTSARAASLLRAVTA